MDPTAVEDPNKNNPTGLTQADHAKSIARKLLLPTPLEDGTESYAVPGGALNGLYTEDDLPALATGIKNRILFLKRTYTKYRDELGETGMGLVDANREHEMTVGSKMKNKWDDIQKKFPYFKTLHNLMGSSPVVDRAALANSTTELDTSILGRGSQPFDHLEPMTAHEDDAVSITDESVEGNTRKRSHDMMSDSGLDSSSVMDVEISDAEGEESMTEGEATPRAKKSSGKATARTPAKSSTTGPSTSAQKRRQPIEVIAEAATDDRYARVDLLKFKERKKTERSTAKARFAYKAEVAKLKRQQLELDLAREEAERQRNFQREMMERQIELERIRAGVVPGPAGHPAGPPPPGPPYNFP